MTSNPNSLQRSMIKCPSDLPTKASYVFRSGPRSPARLSHPLLCRVPVPMSEASSRGRFSRAPLRCRSAPLSLHRLPCESPTAAGSSCLLPSPRTPRETSEPRIGWAAWVACECASPRAASDALPGAALGEDALGRLGRMAPAPAQASVAGVRQGAAKAEWHKVDQSPSCTAHGSRVVWRNVVCMRLLGQWKWANGSG